MKCAPIRLQSRLIRKFMLALACFCELTLPLVAQEPQQAPAKENERRAVIRKESNLVVVRVVVRDAKGKPVEGLKQSDFQVLDDKKLQLISHFSVENAASPSGAKTEGSDKKTPKAGEESPMPRRFTALFFDDYHLEFGNLAQIRDAARSFMAKKLGVGERVAIFTASGHPYVAFTSDPEKLDQGLQQLRFEPRYRPFAPCPDISPYEAQLIDDGLDRDALTVGVALTIACLCNGDARHCPDPESYTKNQARQIVARNDEGAENTLTMLDKLMQGMAGMPGERTIAMVSDGFLNKNQQYHLDTLIDRALRANVIVNAMDARGLYVINARGEVSKRAPQLPPDLESKYFNMQEMGMKMDADVMSYVAEGTGGTFVQNTNDLEGGLGRIASLREIAYVLGFSPENLKLDGKFHNLKVKLVNAPHLSVQARRGYFAAKQAEDAATVEKEEMQQAIFSREEMNGVPVRISTKFFQADAQTFKISVIVHTDLRAVPFRKEANRNLNNLTLMVALFDQDGNYVTAKKKTVNMRLLDATLAQLRDTGVTISEELDAKPGSYVVRAVLLESESQQMGAGNQSVEIP